MPRNNSHVHRTRIIPLPPLNHPRKLKHQFDQLRRHLPIIELFKHDIEAIACVNEGFFEVGGAGGVEAVEGGGEDGEDREV